MIIFTKIRWKNLLSTGNHFTEIDFIGSKTTLISGKNGAGKSTLLDAIIFCLYGKPFRKINKPQLLNSVNQKDLLIELEFKINKNYYLVRRGLKPNIFEIYKNDVLLNQDAAAKDYQEYLEKQILKINLKSFTQIVILGSATYVPFMELTTGGRREVIEDLLDIQIFSIMNTLHKERINENKQLISSLKYEIDLIESKIESAEEHNAEVKRMKELEANKIKEKAKQVLEEIERNKSLIDILREEIEELREKISNKNKLENKITNLKQLEYDINSKRSSINKELAFYEKHNDCPTCKQTIDSEFKKYVVEKKQNDLEDIKIGLEKMSEKFTEISNYLEEIEKTETDIYKLNSKINEHKVSVSIGTNMLKEFKKELKDAEKELEEIDTSKIISLKKERKILNKKYKEAIEQRNINQVVTTTLKDGGIKTMIIKQYVPIMNQFINKYLAAFDLFVNFELDENFNEVIKSRHRDTFSYSSFSEGEKLRISLSILLTWRAVSKIRNSITTNLLILDEVLDGSIDSEGAEALISVLDELNANDNIIIISHRPDIHEKFDRHLNFTKSGDFSHISN